MGPSRTGALLLLSAALAPTVGVLPAALHCRPDRLPDYPSLRLEVEAPKGDRTKLIPLFEPPGTSTVAGDADIGLTGRFLVAWAWDARA